MLSVKPHFLNILQLLTLYYNLPPIVKLLKYYHECIICAGEKGHIYSLLLTHGFEATLLLFLAFFRTSNHAIEKGKRDQRENLYDQLALWIETVFYQ